jgi:hypothetical protein
MSASGGVYHTPRSSHSRKSAPYSSPSAAGSAVGEHGGHQPQGVPLLSLSAMLKQHDLHLKGDQLVAEAAPGLQLEAAPCHLHICRKARGSHTQAPAGGALLRGLSRPPTSREQSRKPSIRPGGCSEAASLRASSGVPVQLDACILIWIETGSYCLAGYPVLSYAMMQCSTCFGGEPYECWSAESSTTLQYC